MWDFYRVEWDEPLHGLQQNGEGGLRLHLWIDGNISEGDTFAPLRAGGVDCLPHLCVEHRGGRSVCGRGDGCDGDYSLFSASTDVPLNSSYDGRGHRGRWLLGLVDGDTTELFSSKRTHYLIDAKLCGVAGTELCGFRTVERSKGL
ncbi:hypothetical protein D3C86_1788340 [compost metagenome]